MPLTPPEWWWHTKIGMVAIPMSAIRKYAPEAAVLATVTLILGIFWSAIESYQPWHILALSGQDMVESNLIVGLTIIAGALPAIPVLWYAERIVDYCGHANILIVSFAVYILRYTGLAILDAPWWTLSMEVLEPVTLGLTWITIVLYFRHVIPRRLTVTGQAIPVIAHFCLGEYSLYVKWSTPVRNFQKSGRIFVFLKTLISFNFYAKNLVDQLMFEVA
jgi:MFS family permease